MDDLLIIFSKSPEAGKVKTRLIPSYGRSYSATIHRRLLWRTLSVARQSDFSNIELWVGGDSKHPELLRISKAFNMDINYQRGKDLGERMFHAIYQSRKHYKNIVLIGTDCADLQVEDLNLALQKLTNEVDVVIGPANDGGYYLIGMNSTYQKLFDDINWGSDDVLQKTRRNSEKLKLKLSEINQRNDVDEAHEVETYVLNFDAY